MIVLTRNLGWGNKSKIILKLGSGAHSIQLYETLFHRVPAFIHLVKQLVFLSWQKIFFG